MSSADWKAIRACQVEEAASMYSIMPSRCSVFMTTKASFMPPEFRGIIDYYRPPRINQASPKRLIWPMPQGNMHYVVKSKAIPKGCSYTQPAPQENQT